ncbi:MAG: DUF3465 domain-containing protein [Halothiobacillaceae bacterium]|jgi:molybdopterin converting factor small subunit|nr:MAG: DUF3465 domain-containing protein [Halothiobacillaceae bacterium]
MNRTFSLIVALLLAAWIGLGPQAALARGEPAVARGPAEQVLAEAFQRQQGDILVEGRGVVEKLLKDDRNGHKHQRFVLRLASGQTVLVAHNIDLAPRIDSLAAGDEIAFLGEYEWNPKGGVIHWTHHDPAGRHPAGWLRHRGRIYQ